MNHQETIYIHMIPLEITTIQATAYSGLWASVVLIVPSELSRGTQIPEYVLQGCLAAFKSRNPPRCLYSNPGTKLMQGKRVMLRDFGTTESVICPGLDGLGRGRDNLGDYDQEGKGNNLEIGRHSKSAPLLSFFLDESILLHHSLQCISSEG
jgi:hypothetical protein